MTTKTLIAQGKLIEDGFDYIIASNGKKIVRKQVSRTKLLWIVDGEVYTKLFDAYIMHC